MSNLEFAKIYREAINNGGGWKWIIEKYRKDTGSNLKEATIKQDLMKRIVDFRKALIDKGTPEEKVMELLPRMRKPKVEKDYSDVVDFLLSEGQV